MKQDSNMAQARRAIAAKLNGSHDDQVLTTPGSGWRRNSTIIDDGVLQEHICSIWHAGLTWGRWRMVAHVIAGAHDLYYAAGVEFHDPLLEDLEFLRQLADTHRRMAGQTIAERIDLDARMAAG